MKKVAVFIVVAAFAGFAWLALPGLDQPQAPGDPQRAAGTGLVVGIDKERSVVTISHGPLPALNMMAMTMDYPVNDKGQVSKLQLMQKVDFQVVFNGNDYLITEIK